VPLHQAALLLFVGSILAASPQPPPSRRGQSPPAVRINVKIPDTMKVSVQGSVRVNARLDEAVTVKLAEPSPWWDSNMFSAFIGAVIGALLVMIGQAAGAKLARGKLHRNSLVRLERRCQDYLNEILTNKRLAGDTKRACEKAALFWHLPNPFEVDRSFAVDIFDIDLAKRVTSLNTSIARYNHDLEHLGLAREGLQGAHLAGTLPLDVWKDAMKKQAEHWADIESFLDKADDEVRDIFAREVLLVAQYDSFRATLLRFFGLGKLLTWPLNEERVARERRDLDASREQELEASRKRLAERYGARARPKGDGAPAEPQNK
jgi:hypothetical protein